MERKSTKSGDGAMDVVIIPGGRGERGGGRGEGARTGGLKRDGEPA